jgi:hypothetical protein
LVARFWDVPSGAAGQLPLLRKGRERSVLGPSPEVVSSLLSPPWVVEGALRALEASVSLSPEQGTENPPNPSQLIFPPANSSPGHSVFIHFRSWCAEASQGHHSMTGAVTRRQMPQGDVRSGTVVG